MKTFLPWLFLFFSSISSAYTIDMINNTNSDMKVMINYLATDICSPDTVIIPSYNTVSKKVGLCCTRPGVVVMGLNNELRGLSFAYNPPRTGFWLSCRSWTAVINQSNHNFVVETR